MMPANNLMRLLMSALAVGSCLTPPVGGEGTSNCDHVVECYPVCGCSCALPPKHWSPASLPASVISLAMLGVDPQDFDTLDNPNSALKDGIFTMTSNATDCTNALEWNNFIGRAVQDLRCPHLSSLPVRSVYNYNQYQDATRESVSFKSGDDVMIGSRRRCATSSSEFASSVDDEEEKLVQFFQRGGEVVLAEARCQTHTVSVNLNTRPIFTTNFHRALRKLSLAADNPGVETSRKAFSDFIEDFGTHYQDTTYFGSRLLIMKLFAKKATSSSEKNKRNRCVSSSFTQNLHKDSSFDEVVEHFNRDVTRCDTEQAPDVLNSLGLPPTRILTVGTVPLPDLDQTLQRPVPIQYRLEKIQRMFQEDWFDWLGCSVDGAVMQEFFENMTSQERHASNYTSCARMVGCGYDANCKFEEKCLEDNTTSEGYFCRNPCEIGDNCTEDKVDKPDTDSEGDSFKKGCSSTANCPPQKVCVDDTSAPGFTCREPCTVPEICASGEACYSEQHSQRGYICVSTKPGRAVILGGLGGGRRLRTVEQVNLESFPELPTGLVNTAAATSGQHVVVCGGEAVGGPTADCHKLSISSPGGGWEAMPAAPMAMDRHTAVSIGQSIVWFIYGRHLVVFDGETQSFSTLNLPFDARISHCSVTNGTHAYIVGAGGGWDEIWVNERSMDGTEWRQVANIARSRYYHACLWYGSNIMITGGGEARFDVEMFNTETGEVWAGQPLLTGRRGHQMMLLDGKPSVVGGTVVGGWDSFDTFESFSLESNRWEKLERTLTRARSHFVLVEVYK